MENSFIPKLHPITLRFSEKWEEGYKDYARTRGLEFDRMISLVGLIVTILAVLVVSHLNQTIPIINGILFGILFGILSVFLGLIYSFSHMKWWGKYYFILANITIASSSIILMLIMYNSLTSAKPFVFGYVYMSILICSVLAMPYIQKSLHFLSFAIGFIIMAYFRGYYDSLVFSIVSTHLMCGVFIGIGVAYQMEKNVRLKYILGEFVKNEKERSRELLHNILPDSIVKKLEGNNHSKDQIVEHYENASILFTDMVGFTKLSDKLGPVKTVQMLNEIFSYFDEVVASHNVEKIKTIGDSYMIASGVPLKSSEHYLEMANVALELKEAADDYIELTGLPAQIRIGIHSGPVVAGIIGTKKFLYDVWGDTVNIASRLESSSEPNKIQVSKEFMELNKDHFKFSEKRIVNLKGKGDTEAYFLESSLQ